MDSIRTRIAPVIAAAAALALSVSLVLAGNTPNAHAVTAAPPSSPLTVPRYYVTFDQPRTDTTTPVGLVLGETLTGKKLFTLRPPKGASFRGITAAADDRTFVADTDRDPYGVWGSEGRSRTWYLLRVVGTGARVSLKMSRLPIPRTPVGTYINSMALSPDGTKFAVATTPWTVNPQPREVLRVYSVATGAVLRSWSSAPGTYPPLQGGGGEGGDDNASLAWIGNRALAYFGAVRKGPRTWKAGVMVLDLSRPDGDLLASSRLAVPVPMPEYTARPPFGCGLIFRGDVIITGDGKSFVCGGQGTSSAALPTLVCAHQPTWNTVAFAGFSLGTGKLTRFLSGYRTGCNGYNVVAYPLWANATGSTVIGYMFFGGPGSGRFGVFSHGSFRPLPYPVPGNWYQYAGGSLLYQVAW